MYGASLTSAASSRTRRSSPFQAEAAPQRRPVELERSAVEPVTADDELVAEGHLFRGALAAADAEHYRKNGDRPWLTRDAGDAHGPDLRRAQIGHHARWRERAVSA